MSNETIDTRTYEKLTMRKHCSYTNMNTIQFFLAQTIHFGQELVARCDNAFFHEALKHKDRPIFEIHIRRNNICLPKKVLYGLKKSQKNMV